MLRVRFKLKKNPYDTLGDILRCIDDKSECVMEIDSDGVRFVSGELQENVFKEIGLTNISSISNYEINKRNIGIKLNDIGPKKVYMVDFGKLYKNEFGGLHPAIVWFSAGDDLWNVIPVTSKRWLGKEATELQFSDPKILKNGNELFVKKAEGVTSFVLFNERRAISKCRFRFYLGELSDEAFDEIIRKANQYVYGNDNASSVSAPTDNKDDAKEKGNSNNVVLESDANLSNSEAKFDFLELTKEQKSLVNVKNSAKLLSICNSSKSIENKVIDLLKVYKIDSEANSTAKYILKIVVETNGIEDNSLKSVVQKVTYGKGISLNKLMEKVNRLIHNRLVGLGIYYVSVESFIYFIAKIAYYKSNGGNE